MIYLLIFLTGVAAVLQIDNFKAKSRKLKIKAWSTLFVLISATVISFIIQRKAEGDSLKDKKALDSTADARVKISTKNILDGFGKAIGKYSLGYDSAKQEIVALQKLIKDSANRKTTIIQGNNPIINFTANRGMVLDSISNNLVKIHVTLTSYSAPSILKYAKIDLLYSTQDILENLTYVSTSPFLTSNLGIPENAGYTEYIDVMIHNSKKVKTIFLLIKGTYTDSYGRNPQQLDIVGMLIIPSKIFGIVPQPYADSIRIFPKTKRYN